ncbi:hypothetical protein C0Q70_01071 [Pomacea canaliculata]|uniref:Uncharacterized protein n=1 Tax=Pomacea canaliculata TaxID=400727 RepID=A0A2T7PYF4_POMCA|nr:hypothetical protein C0Q70_01071 [Pomacea canaliculata]
MKAKLAESADCTPRKFYSLCVDGCVVEERRACAHVQRRINSQEKGKTTIENPTCIKNEVHLFGINDLLLYMDAHEAEASNMKSKCK